MNKILIIPHHPETAGVRIRLIELAKSLSPNNDIFLLNWGSVSGKYTLIKRLLVSFKDLFKAARIYKKNNLNILEFPTLHRPVFMAHRFHNLFLMRFLEKENIDIVINGSYYLFTFPQKRNFRYVVDFADLPSKGFVEKYVKQEVRKADSVTVASNSLAAYVQETCRKHASFIPNGVYIKKMRSVSEEEIKDIRQKHKLTGKYVLGYIGYIGDWVNIDLATKAFNQFKKEFPESALLWVGAGPNLEELKNKYSGTDIVFTGGIKNNVEAYFRLLDVGLLPTIKSPFQDKAFHIKLIEYAAAGKPVVSTPLEESMRLDLPNVIFTEESEAEWSSAFKKAREMVWQKEWNDLVKKYDWTNICNELEQILDRRQTELTSHPVGR